MPPDRLMLGEQAASNLLDELFENDDVLKRKTRAVVVPNTFSIDPATGETAAAGYRSVRVLRLVRRR